MKFDIARKQHHNLEKYYQEDIDVSYKFANALYKELGSVVRAVVLFGSAARRLKNAGSDIDIMVVLDDVQIALTDEFTEAYRLIVQRLVVQYSTRLHITNMRFTTFWDYVRNGDPVAVNILRDGVALIDSGFFDPLQMLLKKGRVRPSQESIWTYYARAPNTLNNAKYHLSMAVVDLYWAVIDAAHAALMKEHITPPTPSHVADCLQKLVDQKKLEKKYVSTMRRFYELMKRVTHREVKEVKGKDFDGYFVEAQAFVDRMKKIIEKDQPKI